MIGILMFFCIAVGLNWRMQSKENVQRKEKMTIMFISIGLFLLAELLFFYQDQWTLPLLLRKASSLL